jgi:SNF2 family DNA or RNA helicase
VTVYKLYAEGTVDEDIFHLGERKSQLSKAVLDDEQQVVADGDSGGEEDVVSPKKKGSKRGKKRDEEDVGGRLNARPADDRNLISNILQKALLSRQRLHQPH